MKDISKYSIGHKSPLRDALIALNELSGDVLTLFVVDDEEKMIGTLTDGDIRRKLIEGLSLLEPVSSVMNPHFKFLREGIIDVSYIKQLKDKKIALVPCLNEAGIITRIFNLKDKKSILPIDAILMAGGKGERLKPLTETTPKPLLKVGNKAIIDYNIDRLILFGVDSIAVTVNYLKEQLQAHFALPRQGVQVRCIGEPRFLGTMGAVRFVDGLTRDHVLVMNSDLFTNIDYEDFYLHYLEHDADMSVAAIPYSVTVPYGIFELEGRSIKGIKEKPSYNYYANAGMYLIKKEFLDLIPSNVVFNATDFIDLLISLGHKVIRYPLTGYWIDIGKHEEYAKAQELVKHIHNEN